MDRHSQARAIRERRGLSVAELAIRAGLARQTIYNVERHPEHKPLFGVMVKLARALEVTLDELREPELVA